MCKYYHCRHAYMVVLHVFYFSMWYTHVVHILLAHAFNVYTCNFLFVLGNTLMGLPSV